jgi:hypothetical protein
MRCLRGNAHTVLRVDGNLGMWDGRDDRRHDKYP